MLLHRVLLSALGRTSVLAAVTVMICAFFVARMVSSLVAAEVLTEDPGGRAPPPVKRIEPPRAKLDGTKIARNIFCSTCVPAEPGPDPGGRYTGEPAVLIATMIGRESRATVRVLATEAQGSWGLGERIPGVGTIDRIGSSSIDVVDVAGHRGTLSLLDASAAQPPPERGAATPRPAPSHPFADRIRKVADGDYEVDRQLVRELVTGSTKAGGVRPVPYMKGGEVHGLRLLGVRSNSVAGALALRNGDIIAAINGEPIRNIQQLLDLYAKLDQLSAVELTGTRAGKPLALTLRLR
jgi:hypothetical protein